MKSNPYISTRLSQTGLCVLLVSFCFEFFTNEVEAQPVVYPGDTHVFDVADDFLSSVSTCDGLNECVSEFSESKQQIDVGTSILGLPKDVTATGKALNYFTLSSSGTQSSDYVTGVISGQVEWWGDLIIRGAFLGDADARIKILARIWESDSNAVVQQQILLDKECAANWDGGCTKFYGGSANFHISANLRRGVNYTIGIIAQCKSHIGIEASFVDCDYGMDYPGYAHYGVTRHPITLEIERDYGEEILILRQELQKLRQDHESHSHIYKTGPGNAHNKEDAETSLPENPNDE